MSVNFLIIMNVERAIAKNSIKTALATCSCGGLVRMHKEPRIAKTAAAITINR